MRAFRTGLLIVATMCAGIQTGFFVAYAGTIMPGLADTDDRTFVAAFQGLERTFESLGENAPFAFAFVGGPVLTLVAIFVIRKSPIVWWLVVALVLFVATIVSTVVFNVPLNNELKEAGDPATIDVSAVREDFRESWWRGWNWFRCATCAAASGCLAWALVLHSRAMKPVT